MMSFLKVSWPLYCFTSFISHSVQCFFPRLFCADNSDAILLALLAICSPKLYEMGLPYLLTTVIFRLNLVLRLKGSLYKISPILPHSHYWRLWGLCIHTWCLAGRAGCRKNLVRAVSQRYRKFILGGYIDLGAGVGHPFDFTILTLTFKSYSVDFVQAISQKQCVWSLFLAGSLVGGVVVQFHVTLIWPLTLQYWPWPLKSV